MSSSSCLVCGYELGTAPWDGAFPSFETCPSCGIEFGFDDFANGSPERRQRIHEAWREDWIRARMPWRGVDRPPAGWDPRQQLRRVVQPIVRVLPLAVVDAIDRLVEDLAAGRHELIESDGRAGGLVAGDLARALEATRVVPVPDEGLRLAQVYPVGARVFAIELPLWTAEGRSDVELRLRSTVTGEEAVELEIVEVLRSRA